MTDETTTPNAAAGTRRQRPLRPPKQAANLAALPLRQRPSGLRPLRQRPRPLPPPTAAPLTTPSSVQPSLSHRLNTAHRVSQPIDEQSKSKPPPGKAPSAPGGEGTAALPQGRGQGSAWLLRVAQHDGNGLRVWILCVDEQSVSTVLSRAQQGGFLREDKADPDRRPASGVAVCGYCVWKGLLC